MQFIKGVLWHKKNLVKKEQKLIFLFLLKIEIEIWNPFSNLIMKTKNEKHILKQKSNVPFDPRII